jgi:hypothetical protein
VDNEDDGDGSSDEGVGVRGEAQVQGTLKTLCNIGSTPSQELAVSNK